MMSAQARSDRHLYRDTDRAMLGGVCAGIAGYFGLNLRVTRLLAFIAFLAAMPVTVIFYLAVVFLVPSKSGNSHYVDYERRSFRGRKSRKARRAKKRESFESTVDQDVPRSNIAAMIDRRCQSMDERLALLEREVTSKRFQIDQELGRL